MNDDYTPLVVGGSLVTIICSVIWALALFSAPNSEHNVKKHAASLAAFSDCVKATQKPAECALATK